MGSTPYDLTIYICWTQSPFQVIICLWRYERKQVEGKATSIVHAFYFIWLSGLIGILKYTIKFQDGCIADWKKFQKLTVVREENVSILFIVTLKINKLYYICTSVMHSSWDNKVYIFFKKYSSWQLQQHIHGIIFYNIHQCFPIALLSDIFDFAICPTVLIILLDSSFKYKSKTVLLSI